MKQRLVGLLLTLLLLALAQEFVPPTAELERRDKKIIAQQTDPQGTFVIDYGDVAVGQLAALDLEQRTLTLDGDRAYWLAPDSRLVEKGQPITLNKLQVGDYLELAYNDNNKNDEGQAQIMRLNRLDAAPTGATDETYVRFVLSDPRPSRVRIQFGDDTLAFGNLAVVEKGLQESVSLSDGSATFNAEDFTLEFAPRDTPGSVELRQGKSVVFGSRLEYDNNTGKAAVTGPIRLERTSDDPLKGSAQAMVYDVDSEDLQLSGGLQLDQNDRMTTAETAIVREGEGFAYLYGSPVRSEGPEGVVEGKRVRYSLDNGDIVVLEGVRAEFDD
jgi:lipopolysaccharide export system protein LptA